MIRPDVLSRALGVALALASATLLAAPLEGVGEELGYRIYGEAHDGRKILLQNSRANAVEVFDKGRGVFVPIPPYSDLEYACRGKSRTLNLRYRDEFREAMPFQVIVECGREIQFMAPAQVAPPPTEIPVETAPAVTPMPVPE